MEQEVEQDIEEERKEESREESREEAVVPLPPTQDLDVVALGAGPTEWEGRTLRQRWLLWWWGPRKRPPFKKPRHWVWKVMAASLRMWELIQESG